MKRSLEAQSRQWEITIHCRTIAGALLFLTAVSISCNPTPPQKFPDEVKVDVKRTLNALVREEDTDGDKKITIDDPHIAGTDRGDKQFWITGADGKRYEIAGTYCLSNLLQDLKLAEESGRDSILLKSGWIFEHPTDRISRMINDIYWDGLTRNIDSTGIEKILSDDKTTTVDGYRYVYVPALDTVAYGYYVKLAKAHAPLRIKVVILPTTLTPRYVRNLDGRHGILTLKLRPKVDGGFEGVPYVVPGGRFNEMYGWDSYFIALGLLKDGKTDIAKDMVDNFLYEIKYYGKILNANRTYYLTRSQPPFLTSMALAVYRNLPKNPSSKLWLADVLEAGIEEYRNVWMNSDHLTKTGLSRYYDTGFGPCPEVEPEHYDAVFALFARRFRMDAKSFEKAYRSGKIKVPDLNKYFVNDRAMRESGHDTSYRLEDRCADLVTVDLNSLLYKVETDIEFIIQTEFSGSFKTSSGDIERSIDWLERATRRETLMNRYLWDKDRGMFFDYDFVRDQRTNYESATTFYPLWAGLASQAEADMLLQRALPKLEAPGGIAASSEESRGPLSEHRKPRQWDYPYGWAPHQMIIWQGLQNYGYASVARQLAYRWLLSMTLNAVNFNGTITEKLNVVSRSHDVFAEYGNIGTKFSYITREGFGWSNASYEVGLSMLSPQLRNQLDALIPPEWILAR